MIGLPSAIWPYKVARFDEVTDAIGSKRSSARVESAGWKVEFTRVTEIGCVRLGLALLMGGLIGIATRLPRRDASRSPVRRSILAAFLEAVVEQLADPDGEAVIAAVGPDGHLVDHVGEVALLDAGGDDRLLIDHQ